jgi:hypothetical protein
VKFFNPSKSSFPRNGNASHQQISARTIKPPAAATFIDGSNGVNGISGMQHHSSMEAAKSRVPTSCRLFKEVRLFMYYLYDRAVCADKADVVVADRVAAIRSK